MNQQAKDTLTRARTHLLFNHGFFGALALRLRLAEDSSHKTMAVDGRTVFYNPDFVNSISFTLCQAVLAHEVMHCVFDHMGRQAARNPRRWNQATDYAINQILEDSGFDLEGTGLLNPAYKGMSADEIYNLLPPDDDDGSGTGDPMDQLLPGNGQSPAQQNQQAVDWAIAAGQAAAAAKQAGKLPGSLERFLDALPKAKVDWKAQLRRFINERSKNDYSWAHPQRRFLARGLVLPGLYSESMGTCVAVSDDSGSVSNELLQALAAEIDAIASVAEPQRLIHISCDARINHVGEFGPGDKFQMVSKGGGGTDFRPPFDYLEENGIKPSCLVYLTDGYGPFPEAAPAYPVLWVMTTDEVPPWGEHIKIEV